MADELNVPVTSRQDAFLAGIMKAAQGSESTVPTPVWDYEKRLYDIWKIAQGEEPVYNLPVHTPHPDAFYSAIASALASGGGGGGYTLIASKEVTANITSTSNTFIDGVALPSSAWDSSKFILVRTRDKAGKRNGYFYSTYQLIVNEAAKNGENVPAVIPVISLSLDSSGKWVTKSGAGYGVFVSQVGGGASEFSAVISGRYNSSNLGTINGTYLVEMFLFDPPDGISPFDGSSITN